MAKNFQWLLPWVRNILLGLLLAAIALRGLSPWLLPRLIFAPPSRIDTIPSQWGIAYTPVRLPAGSGYVHSWWLPAAEPAHAPTVLYLHGSGGNLSDVAGQLIRIQALGLSVLAIDYRGYGHSSGPFPSERRVYQDAEAAWAYLCQTRGLAPASIVIYGHSLGGAIAIELAARHPDAGGLALESSFTSVAGMARHYLTPPIAALLVPSQPGFDSLAKIPAVAPIFIVHGTADRVIPVEMGKALSAAAPEPKQLLLVPGAGHEEAMGQVLPAFQVFVRRHARS